MITLTCFAVFLLMGAAVFLIGVRLTSSKSRRVEKLNSSMLILSNSYIVAEDFCSPSGITSASWSTPRRSETFSQS